jgi:hypothetical protein
MIELHFVCHGCCISMVTLLPWLLDFSGYPVTMFAEFQWLPCYHGCWLLMVTLFTIVAGFPRFPSYYCSWFPMVTLLPRLLVFSGYSVAMVAIQIDCLVVSKQGMPCSR